MADLLPCPFCGGTDLSSGGDDKFVGYSCKTCQATGPNHYGSYNWNTRPAAPVERLETVGYMHPKAKWSHWDKTAIQIRCVAGEKPEELVTRSQAEAIIAAERNRAEVAEYKLDQAVNTVQPMIIQRAERAEADNAAARKALEEIDNLDQAMGHELKLDDAFDAVRIARAALEGKP